MTSAPFSIAETMQRVADARTDNFVELIELAGLDPQRHLRFSQWSGIDFKGCDLRGYDFSGACLRDCKFKGAWIEGARFDKADIKGSALRDADDWEQNAKSWKRAPKQLGDDHLRVGAVFQDAPFAPEMAVIPPGRFMMGSPEDEEGRYDSEGPRHEVTIPHALAVGRYPVTFEEWDFAQDDKDWSSVTGTKPRNPDDEKWGRGRRPVIRVSWDDAKAYVNWLSHRTGQAYRLLSEAEWEYACRAGSDAAWSFGGDERLLGDYAWYNANSGRRTHPVGEKKPNDFGLYDVHGNVWEWCEDLWHENYEAGGAWATRTRDSGRRVLRGGSWGSDPQTLRAAFRDDFYYPDDRFYFLGFRVARTLNP